jgi:hypothetical protein
MKKTHSTLRFVCMALISIFAIHPLEATEIKTSEPQLDEATRIIRAGDLMRLTLKLPGRSTAVLNKVEKAGDVATPDGSFIKADGLTLETFRTNFAKLYEGIHGYEEAKIEAFISSSPYTVIKYPTGKMPDLTSTNIPPPTVYPRNFKTPTSIWKAIQDEGGIPKQINSAKIAILRKNLERKNLDCHGTDGSPDGVTALESGDYLFLIPEKVPVSRIFE